MRAVGFRAAGPCCTFGHVHSPEPARAGRALPALGMAWPFGLLLLLAATIVGDGFNPTDEGLIAATGQRILDGQIPHLDFITPRTAVSAYLHLPELLLPTPLFITGRIVALAEIIAFSVLLAWLILGRSPLQWGLAANVGVAASTLINLNTVPLIPWYTTDGLFLAALGLVLLREGLRRDRAVLIALSFGLLALAAMAKQSFAPVVPIGFLWLLVASHGDRRMRRALLAAAACVVPVGVYVAMVAIGGGLPPLMRQVLSTQPVLGGELLAPLGSPVSVLLLVAAPAAVAWANRPETDVASPARRRAQFLTAAILTALVLTILVTSGLRTTAYWGILLTWLLAAYAVSDAIIARRIDGVTLILVALAWMSSLSYGVPVPNLVAGSVVLALLDRAWRHVRWAPAPKALAPTSIAFGVLFLFTIPSFLHARSEYVHRDAPRAELTADLGAISSELAGIHTNERTAAYLRTMRDCVAAHPASSVTVLPDNPAVYPAFGWINPLPLDFFYPPEYEGVRNEVIAATRSLAARGDFLVLFQRVRADSLLDTRIDLTGEAGPHSYDPALTQSMRSVLGNVGEPVECGAFDGYHAAGS